MVIIGDLFKLVHLGTYPHPWSDTWWRQPKLKHIRFPSGWYGSYWNAGRMLLFVVLRNLLQSNIYFLPFGTNILKIMLSQSKGNIKYSGVCKCFLDEDVGFPYQFSSTPIFKPKERTAKLPKDTYLDFSGKLIYCHGTEYQRMDDILMLSLCFRKVNLGFL